MLILSLSRIYEGVKQYVEFTKSKEGEGLLLSTIKEVFEKMEEDPSCFTFLASNKLAFEYSELRNPPVNLKKLAIDMKATTSFISPMTSPLPKIFQKGNINYFSWAHLYFFVSYRTFEDETNRHLEETRT